ncbi:MAG: hypothetical protein GY810_27785 [Aureispira sp.]|nr:hypothetical protein [Aureispira sp.]
MGKVSGCGLDNDDNVVTDSENYIGKRVENELPLLDELSGIVISHDSNSYVVTGTIEVSKGVSYIGLVVAKI